MWRHIGQIDNSIHYQQFSCGNILSQELGLIVKNKIIVALEQIIKLRNFNFQI